MRSHLDGLNMVSWSNMLRLSGSKLENVSKLLFRNSLRKDQFRNSSHETFVIKPSSWQWQKTKDTIHFYMMLGLIPVGILVTYVNIFIGPATLEPIPEGYEPKHWEYHRHPITRFIHRYMLPPPQQEYERTMHALWYQQKLMESNLIMQRVEDLIRYRDDYQHYFYIPLPSKLYRDAVLERQKIKYGYTDKDIEELEKAESDK